MKRLALIALVVCPLAVTASEAGAQSTSSFGIKGGFVSSSVSTDGPGAFDAEAEAGAAFGAFAAVDFGSRGRFQPEVLWSRRRFSIKDSDAFSVRSTGIELPMLVGVRLATAGRVRPILLAGPQLDFISSVEQSAGGVDTDISDTVKGVDVGILLGGAVEVMTARGAVTFDLRANIGLKDLSEGGTPSFKSRAFLALIGYRF